MQLRFVYICLSCMHKSPVYTNLICLSSHFLHLLSGRYIKNIQEVQDGAAKITAIAWSHNNMKLAVCTADRVLLRLSQSSAIIFVTSGCSSL